MVPARRSRRYRWPERYATTPSLPHVWYRRQKRYQNVTPPHAKGDARPMPKLPNAADLVTLEEAADYAGYRSVSTLRKAAREGRLKVVRLGARTILTTHDWVAVYEDAIYGNGGRPRGHVVDPPTSATLP